MVVTTWGDGMLLASGRERPGMPLNILQSTGQHPHSKEWPSPECQQCQGGETLLWKELPQCHLDFLSSDFRLQTCSMPETHTAPRSQITQGTRHSQDPDKAHVSEQMGRSPSTPACQGRATGGSILPKREPLGGTLSREKP